MTKQANGELFFLPLGGTGEIGMNLNLYGYVEKQREYWIIVDIGVMFGDANTPGVDIITPDSSFIEKRRKNLGAIVLTHAHEDHIGALAVLWPRLRCPVYATSFTAAFARHKLREAGLEEEVPLTIIPANGKLELGPFKLDFVALTHSIPEMNALLIDSPAGKVFHTGDWKFDPDPLIGEPADEAKLRQIGDEGVLAAICDSTNALEEGEAGSEGDVRRALEEAVGSAKGRVFAACFASNIARMESIALAGAKHGRRAVLLGRSMMRMGEIAGEEGLFENIPPFLQEREAKSLPDNKVIFLCTGSQGEPAAALPRLIRGDHPSGIRIHKKDRVLFSSRKIPGNEKAINALMNGLVQCGAEVISASDKRELHVSGHPCRGELERMYKLLRPRIAIPVHGEARHMAAHAELAQTCQVPHVFKARNGTVVRLHPEDGAADAGKVQNGRYYLDGKVLTEAGEDNPIETRLKLARNGMASITLVLNDNNEVVAEPVLSLSGLPRLDEEGRSLNKTGQSALEHAIASAPPGLMHSTDALHGRMRQQFRRALRGAWGKSPEVHLHIVRI